MNNFEKALREIIKAAMSMGGKSPMDVVFTLIPLITGLNQFYRVVKDWDDAVLVEKIREALDAIVGSEPNALFGPTGELMVFDIPHVDDERLTDLLFDSIKAALLADNSQ